MHERADLDEPAERARAVGGVAAAELRDEPRRDRDHDPERDRVDEQRREHERERRARPAHAGTPSITLTRAGVGTIAVSRKPEAA